MKTQAVELNRDTNTVVRIQTMGSLVLPFGFAQRRVYAGPYLHKPAHMIGINLAAESNAKSHMHVPIRDFGVPLSVLLVDKAVIETLNLLVDDAAPVYVGCRGGIGRTGMFLALLAKTLGVALPISFVRANYLSDAVETSAQGKYIDGYVSPLSAPELWWLKTRALFKGHHRRI